MLKLRKNFIRTMMALPLLFALAGCGGSSSDISICGYDIYGNAIACVAYAPIAPLAPPVTSTAIFPVALAMTNIANNTYSFTVRSQDSYGNIYSIQNASAPSSPAPFGAVIASTATVTQNMYLNGVLIQQSTAINYFTLAPYRFLGSVADYYGGSLLVTLWQTPPTTAIVGQQFNSFNATLYHDSSNSIVDGTLIETTSLNADTASTALLCQNDSVQLTQQGFYDHLYQGTTATCYRIDTNGNVLGMQITVPVYGPLMLFY